MKKADFRIGKEFFTAVGRWMCTDVGKRTIVAIKKDMEDATWYNGPPYALVEHVFDEFDFEGCVKSYRQGLAEWGESFRKAEKRKSKARKRRVIVRT
jgi:hypothetical protein